MGIAAIRNIALLAGGAVVYQMIPEKLEKTIPDNYWIAAYAKHALEGTQHIIKGTLEDPTVRTKYSWPFWAGIGRTYQAFNIAEKTLIFVIFKFEEWSHGDSGPAIQLAQENVRSLKEHDVVYQTELDNLEPVAQTLVELIQFANNLTDETSKRIGDHTVAIEALEVEVKDITHMRKEIDLAKVREAAEKVAAYIKTTLNQPKFLNDLTTYDQRLTKIQEKLTQVTERLQKEQELYTEKLGQLSNLMDEYEKLGGTLEGSIKTYKQRAQLQIEKFKPKQTSDGILTTVFNN